MRKNPFKLSRFYYCYLVQNILKKENKKILDIGCGEGYCIAKMKNLSASLFGYDVDKNKVNIAKKNYPFVTFLSGKPGSALPYKDSSMDIIFLFHVLEHVDSEKRIIDEIYRILKPGGCLFLASPYNGLFAWADIANLRYRLPFMHKLLAGIFYGKNKYIELFETKGKELYGDSSLSRNEHKHYKKNEIEKLFKNKFMINSFIRYSLFQPLLLILDNVLVFIFKRQLPAMDWLVWLDNKIEIGGWSNNMLVVAKKYDKKI